MNSTPVQPHATSLNDRQLSQGPTASRIIDGEHWSVELDLSRVAQPILADLARIRGLGSWLTALETQKVGSPEYTHILDRILNLPGVRTVFTLPLLPSEASRLSDELYDAWGLGDEPDRCSHCYTSYKMLGSDLCARCDDGLADRGPVRFA